MKKLLTIVLLFVSISLFAQEEPILGTWKFELEHKINADSLVKDAISYGANISEEESVMLFVKVAIVVMARCETSEISFSEYDKTVLIETSRYNDPTITDKRWGTWVKINNTQYKLFFKDGGVETYRYVAEENCLYLDEAKYQDGLMGKLLSNNLKIVKK
jgi:hypothetical protein